MDKLTLTYERHFLTGRTTFDVGAIFHLYLVMTQVGVIFVSAELMTALYMPHAIDLGMYTLTESRPVKEPFNMDFEKVTA